MIYKIVIKNIIYKYKSQNTILSLLQLYSQPLIGLYSGPSRGGGSQHPAPSRPPEAFHYHFSKSTRTRTAPTFDL